VIYGSKYDLIIVDGYSYL